MLLIIICTIITILSPQINADGKLYTKVENVFQQNITFKVNDIIQCEIKKINLDHNYNISPIYTVFGKSLDSYHFHPVSGKCFSFKVRAAKNAMLLISSSVHLDYTNRIEVYLEMENIYSLIRRIGSLGAIHTLHQVKQSGIVNDRNYSGFWMRWLDDELLEVGRESESTPFLYYRFTDKLKVNYIGIRTHGSEGVWKIDPVAKCPNQNNILKKTRVESDCIHLQ